MAADEGDSDTVDVDTSGIEAAFILLMAWLHRQPEFTPDMMDKEEIQQFIRTHSAILDDAVDYSIRQRSLSNVQVQRLKESNFVFSGFKTFHELNEAFPSLLDGDGSRKPFEQFLNDVQRVNKNYNRLYLKAEYNFAISAADMAAKWKAWEADEDRDRYLLQYRTVGDKRVRESHRLLDNTTLPITSQFWDWYFPPNGWNCRCTAVRVRRGKYSESNESQALSNGSQATAGKHQEMIRFNPGKQMACFPFYNPYTISQCTACLNKPDTLKLVKVPGNELCAACKVIREMAKKKEALSIRRKEILKEASALKGKVFVNPEFKKEIHITGKGIKEWLNQPYRQYAEKNEMLLNIGEVLQKAKYLGHGIDKHDAETVAHLFETKVGKEKSWIIVREYANGEVNLHSISDSDNILKILK